MAPVCVLQDHDNAWQIGLGDLVWNLDQQFIAGPVQLSAIHLSKELQSIYRRNLDLFRRIKNLRSGMSYYFIIILNFGINFANIIHEFHLNFILI